MRFSCLIVGMILGPVVQAQSIDATLSEKSDRPSEVKKLHTDTIDFIRNGIRTLFVDVGKHKSTSDNLKKFSYKYTKYDALRFRSFGLDHQTKDQDANLIQKQLQKDAANVTSKKFMEQSEIYQELRKGLQLKIDFRHLIGATSPPSPKKKLKPQRKIRYGLVIKDFKTQTRSETASLSDMDVHYDATSPRAKVEWTIGPIEEEETHSPVFQSKVDLNADDLHPHEPKTDFDWTKTINPSFVGNVKPAEPAKVGQQVLKGDLAKMETVTTISQTQGLYVLEWKNLGKSGSQKSATQTFSIPVYDQLLIRQKFDLDFEETSTRLEGILVSHRLPVVSVEYSYLTQQTIADSKMRLDSRSELRLTAKNAAKKGLNAAQMKERKHRETYEAGFVTRF